MSTSQTEPFVFTQENTKQIRYSDMSEERVKAMGLTSGSKFVPRPAVLDSFVDELLGMKKVVGPSPEGFPAPNLSAFTSATYPVPPPQDSRTEVNCPFMYHNKDVITMGEAIEWWCSNPDASLGPRSLAAYVGRKWRKYTDKKELLTQVIMDAFEDQLSRVFLTLGLAFTYHREIEIGTRFPDLAKGLAEGYDFRKELVVIFKQTATLPSGNADLVTAVARPSGVPSLGPTSREFHRPVRTLSALVGSMTFGPGGYHEMVIHEFKREGNLTGKGGTQVKAAALASMVLTKRTEQAYVYLTPTEWTFGMIETPTSIDPEDDQSYNSTRKNFTLATIRLKFQDPLVHGFSSISERRRERELKSVFKLWLVWNIVPAGELLQRLCASDELFPLHDEDDEEYIEFDQCEDFPNI